MSSIENFLYNIKNYKSMDLMEAVQKIHEELLKRVDNSDIILFSDLLKEEI